MGRNMRPKLFSSGGISNNFKDRDKDVSISIDTVERNEGSDVKIFVQIEPQSIRKSAPLIIRDQDKFDLILAWDEEILNSCKNSKRFIYGDLWVDMDTLVFNKKDKVSFLMSNKSWTQGHKLRHEAHSIVDRITVCDGFIVDRHMSPPRLPSKNIIFEEYKYSVIIENEKKKNWITEKLIDCLATKTIPIYWGAQNVGEFFNTDGIIQFDTVEDLKDILTSGLSSEKYKSLESVMDYNSKEALKYSNFFDRVDTAIDSL